MKSLFLLLGILSIALLGEAKQPNIVVILTDDQGWGDLSLSGNTNLSTPNIDSLAADGASFDRFYVCPVCSPTRAEFLTGRYHQRGGVYSTSAGGERLDLDETTIGDVFKQAGYRTAAFGKWHNGMQFPYHPNGRGFDEFYGFCSGHWGDYFSPMLEHNGEIVTGEGFVVDDFTNKAMEFIESHKEEPFFVYLPYNTPHSPMQVPDEFWGRFEDKPITMRNREPEKEDDLHLRCALAMCENIDWNVGRLLKKLDDLELAEDTIVIYFCDNGPNGVRWNGDMKGKKGATDEGGVRSPMLIRWPAGIDAGTRVSTFGAAIDLLPTLTEMAGVPLISTKPLDGISLAAVLTGQGEAPGDLDGRPILSAWKTKSSIRTKRF
ncbi:MAG: arylsulfatase, partial [Verrucomicrobiales bacterium]|nr:arylsulfatase [Verrucomicrobiales bacterium]